MSSLLGGKVSIIGGTGRMGQWFAKFFKGKGFEVVISGRNTIKSKRVAAKLNIAFAKTNNECVKDSDLVIVATPIEVTPQIVSKIARNLKRGAILFDIASVKETIIEQLKTTGKFGVKALSVHPMFGPGAKNIKGKPILIVPAVKNSKTIVTVSNFFKKAGAKVFIVKNAEEHDRMIALTLALPHLLNILFSTVLKSSGDSIRYVKKFSGTTFALQLLIAESVLQEDPATYAAIQLNNKYFKHILEKLIIQIDSLKKVISSKNSAEFEKIFNSAKNYISQDPQFKVAYKKFYGALESVT